MKKNLKLNLRIFLIILLLVCVQGSTLAATKSENIATVIQYIEGVMNNKNYDLIEKLVHSDEFIFRALHHPAAHGGLHQQHIEHQYLMEMSYTNIPDSTTTINDIAAEGDIVFTYVTNEATYYADAQSEGKLLSWDTIMMFRLKDGEIVKITIAENNEQVNAQKTGEFEIEEKRITNKPTSYIKSLEGTHNISANIAKVVEFTIAYENDNLDKIANHFHDNYSHTTHLYPNNGRGGKINFWKEERNLFNDLDFNILNISADGDVVFVHWKQIGIVKTSKTYYNQEGMTLFYFKKGEIYNTINIIDTGVWKKQVSVK